MDGRHEDSFQNVDVYIYVYIYAYIYAVTSTLLSFISNHNIDSGNYHTRLQTWTLRYVGYHTLTTFPA